MLMKVVLETIYSKLKKQATGYIDVCVCAHACACRHTLIHTSYSQVSSLLYLHTPFLHVLLIQVDLSN